MVAWSPQASSLLALLASVRLKAMPFCQEVFRITALRPIMQFGMERAVTTTFKKDRLLPLDLLRGLAASVVAVGHANVFSNLDYSLCVVFFYILSGYVLAYAYGEAIGSDR